MAVFCLLLQLFSALFGFVGFFVFIVWFGFRFLFAGIMFCHRIWIFTGVFVQQTMLSDGLFDIPDALDLCLLFSKRMVSIA